MSLCQGLAHEERIFSGHFVFIGWYNRVFTACYCHRLNRLSSEPPLILLTTHHSLFKDEVTQCSIAIDLMWCHSFAMLATVVCNSLQKNYSMQSHCEYLSIWEYVLCKYVQSVWTARGLFAVPLYICCCSLLDHLGNVGLKKKMFSTIPYLFILYKIFQIKWKS